MAHARRSWYRLDNAAKIYPVTQTGAWTPMFRFTAVMRSDIDPDKLQAALDAVSPRFPTFMVCLKTGMFWYYLEQLDRPVIIEHDALNPCAPIQRGDPLFRIRYYANRLSLEMHHVVTDGGGAMVFFKTLLAQYLREQGHEVPCTHGILDIGVSAAAEEIQDSFPKFSKMRVLSTRSESKAYHISGTRLPLGLMRVTTGEMDVSQALGRAHSYGATLTEFMVALLIQAAYRLQLAEGRPQYPVKVSVPIDLRKYYPTATIRNFSQYLNPGIDPQYGEFTFEEILSQVHHYMRLNVTEKNLNARISKNVSDERNPVIRMVPLFIKKAAMFIAYMKCGESTFTMPFSNLGRIMLPEIMYEHIERIDFILHTARFNVFEAGASTLNGRLSVSLSSLIAQSHMERLFFTSLVKQGIKVKIESNEL